MLKLWGTQRGDTIVEVLIALAILGLALGISYATANRSLSGARQAQEHSEALGLVQEQIEWLRAKGAEHPEFFDTTSSANGGYKQYFCIDTSGDPQPQSGMSNDGDLTNTSKYGPACLGRGDSGLYNLTVKDVANGGKATFTVSAVWDDVTGTGTDSVSLVYRLSP